MQCNDHRHIHKQARREEKERSRVFYKGEAFRKGSLLVEIHCGVGRAGRLSFSITFYLSLPRRLSKESHGYQHIPKQSKGRMRLGLLVLFTPSTDTRVQIASLIVVLRSSHSFKAWFFKICISIFSYLLVSNFSLKKPHEDKTKTNVNKSNQCTMVRKGCNGRTYEGMYRQIDRLKEEAL